MQTSEFEEIMEGLKEKIEEELKDIQSFTKKQSLYYKYIKAIEFAIKQNKAVDSHVNIMSSFANKNYSNVKVQ